ncbi:helix-turn-helix domain-containing protein [Thiolapillus sp.]|nr:helix-turn-helix domain-containing protein [Thiolapillus sp.]
MEAYQWPGNIRELENVLMKGVALSHSDTFTRELLPEHILCQSMGSTPPTAEKPLTARSLKDIEKEHISRILEANNWHRGKACEVLGVSRPRLRRMINEYGLVPPQGIVEEEED